RAPPSRPPGWTPCGSCRPSRRRGGGDSGSSPSITFARAGCSPRPPARRGDAQTGPDRRRERDACRGPVPCRDGGREAQGSGGRLLLVLLRTLLSALRRALLAVLLAAPSGGSVVLGRAALLGQVAPGHAHGPEQLRDLVGRRPVPAGQHPGSGGR